MPNGYAVNPNDNIITQGILDRSYGVRPVINLRADIEFEGNGSFETPYTVVME